MQADSTVFRDPLIPGKGELALSPDGRYVYITNPGTLNSDAPPAYSFAVYDTQTMTIDSTLAWAIADCYVEGSVAGAVVTDFVITPDGQYLLGNQLSGAPPGMVLFYDLLKNDTAASVCISRHSYLMYPACQNSL